MPFSIFRKIASPTVAVFNFLKKSIAPDSEGLNFDRAALNGQKHIIFILYQYRIL
jgi:hypothetical protein